MFVALAKTTINMQQDNAGCRSAVERNLTAYGNKVEQ